LSLAAAAVLLAGCAAAPPREREPEPSKRDLMAPASAAPEARDTGPIALNANSSTKTLAKPEIEKGTGQFINEAAARAAVSSAPMQEGEVTFNFENQPIQAVVKAFLGDLLKQNYVIAPGVQGNVTFSTSKPIRAEQAMPILEMLLSWTNNTLVWGDGRYTVLPVKDAISGKLTPRVGPIGQGKGYEVRVFPLRYIAPKEMEKLLKPYARGDAFVSVDTARSMLVLAGTPAELQNYQRTIDIFDVDWLKGMSVGVYPIAKVEVAKIMPELDKLFGATGESPMAGMFRFVPIERTNSIIVITSNEDYLAKAEEWLKRLDQAGSDSGQQLYVYDVVNIKAADLADRLSEVFSGQSSGGGRSTRSRGTVAPGLQPVQGRGGTNTGMQQGSTGGVGGIGTTALPRSGSSDSGDSGSHSGSFKLGESDSEVRISAVAENNQLLVMGTPSQWGIIETAIKRLDTQPLQVQIETKILEVSLTGNLSYGVQWYLEGLIGTATGSPAGFNQPGNIQQGQLGSGGFAAPTSGLFYSYIGPEVQAAIRALETSGNTRIVSAPSLLVLNNREANIQVGNKIPVVQTF
jgi:general secretion pathway protein D